MKLILIYRILGCAAVLIFSILLDQAILFRTDVGVGIDGYYYILQVRTFLAHGSFYFPNHSPLILYLFSFLSLILGDPVSAIKAGACLLHALLCFGIFSFLVSVTRSFWVGWGSWLIAAFSGLHFYLIGEFLDQLGSLVFLIWMLFAVSRFCQTRSKYYLLLSAILFTGAIFSHRSAVFLTALLLFTGVCAYFFTAKNFARKIFALVVFLAAFIFPLLAASQPFYPLPDFLLAELSFYPKLPNPATLAENTMLAVVFLGTAALLIIKPYRSERNRTILSLLTGVFFSLLTAFNPFLQHSKGFLNITGRLDGLAYLTAALTAPLLIFLYWEKARAIGVILIAVLIPALAWSFSRPLPPALTTEYLNSRRGLIEQLNEEKKNLCSRPLIVAAHGEQFLVTAVTGAPSQQEFPEAARPYECVYWLLKDPVDYEDPKIKDTEYILLDDENFRSRFGSGSSDEAKRWLYLNPGLRKILKK